MGTVHRERRAGIILGWEGDGIGYKERIVRVFPTERKGNQYMATKRKEQTAGYILSYVPTLPTYLFTSQCIDIF